MNKFDNDGSFLDQFKKENKDKCEQEKAIERTEALKKPIKVTWKMKGQMGGIKKKSIATLMKEGPTKKADVEDEEEMMKTLTKEETNAKEQKSPHQGLAEVDAKLKEGSYQQSMSVNKTTPEAKASSASGSSEKERIKRKRKSRWGKELTEDERAVASACATFSTTKPQPVMGSRLTPEQQRQLNEQQQMTAVVAQIRAAQHGKKNKYEYDSDEETEGGTWEHKLRAVEMQTTKDVAEQLTESNKGKHHIGDFLPPEELEKFMEKVKAIQGECDPDLSDYAKNKIDESNIGYQMLKNAGWTEGQGLGSNEDGITAPINKGKVSFDQTGVGMEAPGEVSNTDNEFDMYRKRMMLAYRFRPNPLNNPRRPYY